VSDSHIKKCSTRHPGLTYIFNFWRSGTGASSWAPEWPNVRNWKCRL